MAIEIPLTRGKVAIVDDEDFELVSQYNWYAMRGGENLWYALSCKKIKGKKYYTLMHRLIMGFPESNVDHKNGDSLDNRRANLREATHRQNLCNQRKQTRSRSIYKGVHYSDIYRNKWQAEITYKGKKIKLGHHVTEAGAALAYDTAAKLYFGEFARLNFPNGLPPDSP